MFSLCLWIDVSLTSSCCVSFFSCSRASVACSALCWASKIPAATKHSSHAWDLCLCKWSWWTNYILPGVSFPASHTIPESYTASNRAYSFFKVKTYFPFYIFSQMYATEKRLKACFRICLFQNLLQMVKFSRESLLAEIPTGGMMPSWGCPYSDCRRVCVRVGGMATGGCLEQMYSLRRQQPWVNAALPAFSSKGCG